MALDDPWLALRSRGSGSKRPAELLPGVQVLGPQLEQCHPARLPPRAWDRHVARPGAEPQPLCPTAWTASREAAWHHLRSGGASWGGVTGACGEAPGLGAAVAGSCVAVNRGRTQLHEGGDTSALPVTESQAPRITPGTCRCSVAFVNPGTEAISVTG